MQQKVEEISNCTKKSRVTLQRREETVRCIGYKLGPHSTLQKQVVTLSEMTAKYVDYIGTKH